MKDIGEGKNKKIKYLAKFYFFNDGIRIIIQKKKKRERERSYSVVIVANLNFSSGLVDVKLFYNGLFRS